MRTPAALLLIMASMLLGDGGALAQSPQKQAIILYNEANVHYNTGQYDLAVAKYQAAIRADPSLPGPYRNLGLTYRALKKCDMALPNFRKYLQLRPSGRHSERVREEITACEKVVGTAAPAPVGAAQIVLRCPVKGAQVHIDGKLRGSTPTEGFPVQPGKHVVTVYRAGYEPWTGAVELVEGQVAALDVELKPETGSGTPPPPTSTTSAGAAGRLRVVGLSPGLAVSIDGGPVQLDHEGSIALPPGEHGVSVTGRGVEPWSSRVAVKAGETTTVMPVVRMSEMGRKLRRWGWITTGLAAAVGVAAGAVGLAENATYEEIRDYDRGGGTRAGLNDLVDKRRRQALAANLLYGAAGALLGTGVVLFLLAPDHEVQP